MINFRKIAFISICILGLTACGDAKFEQESLALKQVPVENIDQVSASETEVEPAPPESPEKPKTMSLRDKVLQNSNVSETALDNALSYYDQNKNLISRKSVISIFDITKHSGKRRLYIIDTKNGNVSSIHVAHGKNSDTNHDGIATSFSNKNGSNKSSLGFMLTAETYYGKNGYSLKLDGLESRNSNVRKRYVVIHGADYVKPSFSKMGRSLGCPAVSRANTDWYINKVKGGSLLYIYHAAHDG